MRKFYTIRAYTKQWLVQDTSGYRGRRMAWTKSTQISAAIRKRLKKLNTINKWLRIGRIKNTYDPYECIEAHQESKREVSSRLESMQEQHAKKWHKRDQTAAKFRAMGEQEVQKPSTDKSEKPDENVQQVRHKALPKEEYKLIYETDKFPESGSPLDKAAPEVIKSHFEMQGDWYGALNKFRQLNGKLWVRFPMLPKRETVYDKPSDKGNLLSTYGNAKQVLFLLVVILIELAEGMFITHLLSIAMHLEGWHKYTTVGFPVAFGLIVYLATIKKVGDWLRQSIHFSWKQTPKAFLIGLSIFVCAVVAGGLIASDNAKLDAFITEQSFAAAEEDDTDGLDLIFGDEEDPQGESETIKLPERDFPQSIIVLYVLFALCLGSSAGIFAAVLHHISKYMALKTELKKQDKELEQIENDQEKLRETLNDLLTSMEDCMDLLGRLQYFEDIISGRLDDKDVDLIIKSIPKPINGSKVTESIGVQSISNHINHTS